MLVLPYRKAATGDWEYAAFRRSDENFWQFIAGGGEDDETPLAAARRESREEAGIPEEAASHPLVSTATIPVTAFPAYTTRWIDEGTYVVPEHSFAVDATSVELRLSDEHAEFRWGSKAEIGALLKFDSSRNALWELTLRLARGDLSR